MPLQSYTATLSDRKVLTPTFHQLRFELKSPNRIEFQAGQYILLSVPTTPQRKSYSIASAPQVDHAFELLVDLAPQGHGTQYLESLQLGDEISFMAPVGLFVIAPADSAQGQQEQALEFVATGSGIAPFKGILEDLLIAKNDQRPIKLYWGLRYSTDQFWFDEFSQLAQQHPNFSFHPTLSKPPDEWQLCRGRVTDCLLVHPQPPVPTGYYLCGNSAMIGDVKRILAEKGVPETHVHHEKFY